MTDSRLAILQGALLMALRLQQLAVDIRIMVLEDLIEYRAGQAPKDPHPSKAKTAKAKSGARGAKGQR